MGQSAQSAGQKFKAPSCSAANRRRQRVVPIETIAFVQRRQLPQVTFERFELRWELTSGASIRQIKAHLNCGIFCGKLPPLHPNPQPTGRSERCESQKSLAKSRSPNG